MQCASNSGCSIAHSVVRSFSIGWTSTAGGPWISGGFAVVQNIETGNAYNCNGNPNDFFAVWKKQAQTAYTVRDKLVSPCYSDQDYGTRIIWSPNDNNRGGEYYCVYGRGFVRNLGDRWLDTSGNQPGGP
jgi:hypothetical protein